MIFKVKKFSMKNKLFYIIPALTAVAIICFAAIKNPLPSAVTESTAVSSSLFSTQKATELSTSEKTTVKPSEAATTTEKQELSTKASAETSALSTTTEAATKGFGITLPSIQIPAFRNEPTTASKPTSTEYNPSYFDDTAFIGNSRFISFKNFGLAKNVYSVVGLNVETVFTKSVAGSTVPVIDELDGKSYKKVVLLFGDNECGWPNPDVFAEKYSKVIAAVKEKVPEAEIYLHAILPVSADASKNNQFGCNNEKIAILNKKIEELASKEGVRFISQPDCLKAADGSLIPEAASDGIHLNKKYAKIWIISLAEEII